MVGEYFFTAEAQRRKGAGVSSFRKLQNWKIGRLENLGLGIRAWVFGFQVPCFKFQI